MKVRRTELELQKGAVEVVISVVPSVVIEVRGVVRALEHVGVHLVAQPADVRAEVQASDRGVEGHHEVLEVHVRRGLAETGEHRQLALVAQSGRPTSDVAEHVAHDEGGLPLGAFVVGAHERERALVEDAEVSRHADDLPGISASADAGEASGGGQTEFLIVIAVTGEGEQVDVAMNVDGRLALLEGGHPRFEVAQVFLEGLDVYAERSEFLLELLGELLEGLDVILPTLHAVDGCLQRRELIAQFFDFAGKTAQAIDLVGQSLDLIIQTVIHALQPLVRGVDRHGHLITARGAGTSEQTVRVSNEDALLLHVLESLIRPVIVRHVREIVLRHRRYDQRGAQDRGKRVN